MDSTGRRSPGAQLLDSDGRASGAELASAVLRHAEALRARGVRPGDRVLLRGENSSSYVLALLTLAHLDVSLTLIDAGLPPADVAAAATRIGARWLVQEPAAAREVPADVTALPVPELGPAGAEADPRRVSLAAWRRREDALVLWSSGTTGPPKAVLKSGAAVLDNLTATQRVMRYRRDDVLAPWLPFSHQYGLSVVLLWWLTGATLVVSPYRSVGRAVDEAIRFGATVVDAPPSTYYTLLRLIDRRSEVGRALAGVRYWCVGGAPLPAPLAESFRRALGRPLLDGYGSSELGNVALARPEAPVGCGPPLPGVRLRVVDPAGAVLPAGEPGEIEVRSGGLMTGYLTGSGLVRPERWFRTDDLGYLDPAGNLHVSGRRRAVHRHGHTLYPESIERRAEAACGRPVTVLAVPDQRRGATLVFVVDDPAGRPAQHWRRLLCAALPAPEHPNQVAVRDGLPLTATGKPDRARLRADLEKPKTLIPGSRPESMGTKP